MDALYFAWVSLIPSSLDIGLSPQTALGKGFTMMYLVVGVAVMIGLLAIIAKVVINFGELDKKEHPMDILKEKRKKAKK